MRITVDNGIETVTSGLDYSDFVTITKKVCLDAGRRYQFQIRNKSGGAITSNLRLVYGGETLFDSSERGEALGRVSSSGSGHPGCAYYGADGEWGQYARHGCGLRRVSRRVYVEVTQNLMLSAQNPCKNTMISILAS